jgi:hypothetical protein
MKSIYEINIAQDEGSVMAIIEENLDVAMATRKAEKQDSFCPGIAKVGIFAEGC